MITTKQQSLISESNVKYEITIKGMDCTSCVTKIEGVLEDKLYIKYLNINLITEKMKITLENSDQLNFILKIINDLGFTYENVTKLISNNKSKTRKIELRSFQTDKIIDELYNLPGIIDIIEQHKGNFNNNIESKDNEFTNSRPHKNSTLKKINIFYDPLLIKAFQVLDILDGKNLHYIYINQVQAFIDEIEYVEEDLSTTNFFICILLVIMNLTYNLLI